MEISNLAQLVFELRTFKYIQRAGLQFLRGPARENLAEHTFFATILGLILASLEGANENKIIKMCLIHDFPETRTGERNLINKFYVKPNDEEPIFEDQASGLTEETKKLFEEYREEKTKDALIVHDADILAQLLLEKECFDLGNQKAQKWIDISLKRLKTPSGQKLGQELAQMDADQWWFDLSKKMLPKVKFL